MKNSGWIVTGIVVLLVAVGVAASLFTNQQNTSTNPNVTASPRPSITTTPSPTVTPTPTPTATPTPQPIPNIAISYSYRTEKSINTQYGFPSSPADGKVFLVVNMTIRNNGYSSSFNTNPYNFNLIADNIKYDVDFQTYSLNRWETVDVMNGGIFDGVLVFQVPQSATSFTLAYEAFLTNFNIIWTKT